MIIDSRTLRFYLALSNIKGVEYGDVPEVPEF